MKLSLYSLLIVILSLGLFSCSKSTSPQGEGPELFGAFRLMQVRCNGAESTLVKDKDLQDNISVVVTYSGSHAIRETNFYGCEQTVPMEDIQYSGSGLMRITEKQSSCNPATREACAPISAVCATDEVINDVSYALSEDRLVVTIPPNPEQLSPCGAEQNAENYVFIYQRQH